ncbi:MAG: metallophosphoesterase [Ruminococcus sp.]|nr:metallophosphoesterase [Candidatus Copronaster equi]
MKKVLRKTLSILLCLSMLAGVVAIESFAGEESLKITVSSDTHFQCRADVGNLDPAQIEAAEKEGLLNSEIYYHASFQGQMNHESEALARAMLDDFAKSDSEYLLIAGDLTGGKRQSHNEFAKMLKETEEKCGKQIFVVCGNHDCDDDNYDKNISVDEFMQIYQDFGYNEALYRHDNSASYAVDLSDEYRLLAIDSCIYGKDDGQITDSVLEWVEQQAEQAEKDGKHLVAMMHHSLLSHFKVQPMFKNSSSVAEKFAQWGIKIVFTGHIHANDASMARSENGKTIYDIQTGSLITSPNAYREVEFTDEEISVTSKFVAEIDTKYLPDGFNEKQLELIKTDFPAYSYGYFEAGICRWLNKYIGSAGKVGKLMKLDVNSKEYAFVDSIMKNVGEALNLPIYDDGSTPDTVDSIEEIAGLTGNEIPESNYTRLYQLAARVMNGFYHGDEAESVKTTEFPLLYACLKAVLARSVANLVFGNDINSIINDCFGVNLYDKTLTEVASFNFANTVADKILEATLLTVCDGFVGDFSEPSDINFTVQGYGVNETAQKTVPLTIFEKIFAFIKYFLKNLFA